MVKTSFHAVCLMLCAGLSSSCQKLMHATLESKAEYERAVPSMESVFSITFWEQDSAKAEMAMDAVLEEIDDLDQKTSDKSDSELSFVNQNGGKDPIALTDNMFDMVSASLQMCRKTSGLFDISVAPLAVLWGFDQPVKGETRAIPSSADIEKAKKTVGCEKIKIDPNDRTIELNKNTTITLRSIRHGFALDQAAKILKEYNIGAAKMSFGNQLYFFGASPDATPWKVSIKGPKDPRIIANIETAQGAVSLTQDTERYFMHENKKYSHVLDPRTGWPVRDISTTAVWAASALEAASWSYALFVAGQENGSVLVKPEKKLTALWVMNNEQISFVDSPNAKVVIAPMEVKRP